MLKFTIKNFNIFKLLVNFIISFERLLTRSHLKRGI